MLQSILLTVLAAQGAAPVASRWSVAADRSLQWEGATYRPIGARIAPTPELIRASKEAGIQDLLVEVPGSPSAWNETLLQLEDGGTRYWLMNSGLVPSCRGTVVEPESYRFAPVTGRTNLDLPLPGATEALIVVSTQRDSIIRQHLRVPVVNGQLQATLDPDAPGDHIALIYPVVEDARVPDAWDGLDAYRDEFLASRRQWGELKSLRGIVNPIGTLPQFPDAEIRFVPTSPRFQSEFAEVLRKKYTSVPRLEIAWTLGSNDLKTFEQAAALVPLWSERRGLAVVWDPTQNRILKVDRRQTTIWKDIQDATLGALRRRYRNFVDVLSTELGVPVVQSWAGWNGPYAGESTALAGLGFTLPSDSYQSMLEGGARAMTSLRRWNRPGILFALDLPRLPNEGADGAAKRAAVESAGLGVRGWFTRVTDPAEFAFVKDLQQTLESETAAFTGTNSFLTYPEAAHNPAYPMRIEPGLWWLPTPDAGQRIDFGPEYGAYRTQINGTSTLVIWRNDQPKKALLRTAEGKNLVVMTASGVAVPTKVSKTTVELTIGTTPLLITGTTELPVPDDAAKQTLAEYAAIEKMFPKDAREAIDEAVYFRQAAANFERSPGTAYFQMRLQLERLKRMVSPIVWVEGEQARGTTFSDVQPVSGASADNALALLTRLPPADGSFFATWVIQPKYEGTQTLWVALKGDNLRPITFSTLDQQMQVSGPGISPYGNGFRWYRLGSINLPRQSVQLQIRVPAPYRDSLFVDALMIAPDNVTPDGVKLPWSPPDIQKPK